MLFGIGSYFAVAYEQNFRHINLYLLISIYADFPKDFRVLAFLAQGHFQAYLGIAFPAKVVKAGVNHPYKSHFTT